MAFIRNDGKVLVEFFSEMNLEEGFDGETITKMYIRIDKGEPLGYLYISMLLTDFLTKVGNNICYLLSLDSSNAKFKNQVTKLHRN